MSHSSGPWAHPPRSRSNMSALYKFLFFAGLVLICIVAMVLSWAAFEHATYRTSVELAEAEKRKGM